MHLVLCFFSFRNTYRKKISRCQFFSSVVQPCSLSVSVRFLRCSPFDEYKLWKAQVDNGSRRGRERLNILTRSLLLRRTKNQLDSTGKPLVGANTHLGLLLLWQHYTEDIHLWFWSPWLLRQTDPTLCKLHSLLILAEFKIDCFRFLFLIGPARCIDSNCPRMNRLYTMWSSPNPGNTTVNHRPKRLYTI